MLIQRILPFSAINLVSKGFEYSKTVGTLRDEVKDNYNNCNAAFFSCTKMLKKFPLFFLATKEVLRSLNEVLENNAFM